MRKEMGDTLQAQHTLPLPSINNPVISLCLPSFPFSLSPFSFPLIHTILPHHELAPLIGPIAFLQYSFRDMIMISISFFVSFVNKMKKNKKYIVTTIQRTCTRPGQNIDLRGEDNRKVATSVWPWWGKKKRGHGAGWMGRDGCCDDCNLDVVTGQLCGVCEHLSYILMCPQYRSWVQSKCGEMADLSRSW